VDASADRIKATLRACGAREIPSRQVGASGMHVLRTLDELPSVRVVSVYRSFRDLDEFRQEIERLSKGD